jgi:Pirin-related protein
VLGTGVYHSEYNKNQEKEINLLQLGIFPNKRNVTPRYDQIPIHTLPKKNEAFSDFCPHTPMMMGVWIHQNAWFHLLDLDAEPPTYYDLKAEREWNKPLFFIEGWSRIGEQLLGARDAAAIQNSYIGLVPIGCSSMLVEYDGCKP